MSSGQNYREESFRGTDKPTAQYQLWIISHIYIYVYFHIPEWHRLFLTRVSLSTCTCLPVGLNRSVKNMGILIYVYIYIYI